MIENGRELIGGVDDALVLAMIEWRYVFGDCVAYTDVVWVRGVCVPTALASILYAIGKTCSRRLMQKSHCRKQYASVKGRWSYRLFDFDFWILRDGTASSDVRVIWRHASTDDMTGSFDHQWRCCGRLSFLGVVTSGWKCSQHRDCQFVDFMQ